MSAKYNQIILRNPIISGIVLTILQFLIIYACISIGPKIGITGWYTGIFTNIICSVAVLLLTDYLGWWKETGLSDSWKNK